MLVNALVHRDYLVSAPIRLFIFDNRIEIISPGSLPNNLTVEKILAGNSNIRNPILVSCIAKGILPCHGLGSGVKRALENWPDIEFVNDADACLFTALVKREGAESSKPSENEIAHSDPINDLITLLKSQPTAEYASLAEVLSVSEATVKRYLQRLKREGRIQQVGSKKSGHWEVLS